MISLQGNRAGAPRGMSRGAPALPTVLPVVLFMYCGREWEQLHTQPSCPFLIQ